MYFLANQFTKFSDIEENGEREEISAIFQSEKWGKVENYQFLSEEKYINKCCCFFLFSQKNMEKKCITAGMIHKIFFDNNNYNCE